ncbi:Oligopeptide transporter OPT superfamily [Corchorus olitorius]|uniref:Oligopeptide transporter OPT superfamily n=1 Tax=Corchorus olitorius TaxID=93759 RepID=A0A1R3KIS3_9ROSI|nr:Oligopeptide transporter OPT superfamily [Corchorus olitorius]
MGVAGYFPEDLTRDILLRIPPEQIVLYNPCLKQHKIIHPPFGFNVSDDFQDRVLGFGIGMNGELVWYSRQYYTGRMRVTVNYSDNEESHDIEFDDEDFPLFPVVTYTESLVSLKETDAATLPTHEFRVPFTKWSFSLNPGPFTLKEHVLITIFANCGAGGVYAVNIITIVKAFYHRSFHPVAAILLAQTTQLLGYGWAGLFRKFLVDSPYMWWPATLVQDSITIQQIGSGLNGFGIGSFGLDWSTVAAFLGSPLATPLFAIINILVGFILFVYLLTPIAYWSNWYQARRFPLISSHTFDAAGFGKQLQLPWWGVLLACALALFFTLPIGVIQATTNMQPGLNVITELVIGYIYPGKPLANVAFKTYGYISMVQALNLVGDFKLGHYMKIPPKSMFIAQLVGTMVASSFYFGTAWWLLSTIEHICDPSLLPAGSPWTCPGDDVFHNASIIWGVVGPLRMFTKFGNYPQLNWFFLIGFLAPVPVWLLSRKFPEKTWIKLIHMPMILGATQGMPPAKAVHYICWGTVGIFFNWYVYNRYKRWWAKHTYILSAALDAGLAFMGVLLYFTLQSKDIVGPEWWGLEASDHCPLAKCPTAPGIITKGCPVL